MTSAADRRAGVTRRRFLGVSAAAAASIPVLAACSPHSSHSSSAPWRPSGKLEDVEHVVILMQENRSFDHYFGTMRGVRGFGDSAAIRLASGGSVFAQPARARPDGGTLLPFRVDTSLVDGQALGALDHTWNGTHQAWNAGGYDQWIAAKTEMTMAYFDAGDIPFHRELAAAFTTCDNYFCSVQGPTVPNRLYLWTGTIDPLGQAGGPVIGNPPPYTPVYHWTTYPERLQKAGISWQVFANDEVGDQAHHPYAGDFGDNVLWHFQAYHDALASSDEATRQLAERANVTSGWKPDSGLGKSTDHVLEQFISACAGNALPAVSWVVAPYAYTEHPAARPIDGAAYVQRMLQAIWANPELWAKTVVLIDYDENDGFFDHVPPPVAPAGTAGEFIQGQSIGLGPRAPMIVVSPWSQGGFVNSQVFDHTSVLRFLEAWTGVREENITAWRRQVCGDLLTCFDFATSNVNIPTLPDTAPLRQAADQAESKLPMPSVPAVGQQRAPTQESGDAPARPLPYQSVVSLSTAGAAAASPGVTANLANHGQAGVQFALYGYHLPDVAPQRVDVAPGAHATTQVAATDAYDVAVHGPNGFVAEAAGSLSSATVEISAALGGTSAHPTLVLSASNSGAAAVTITGLPQPLTVAAGGQASATLDPLAATSGWYDVTLKLTGDSTWSRRFAGHLENGQPSRTG